MLGKDTRPFSGPCERSRGIETGNLQEIAVRALWDPTRGPKLLNFAKINENPAPGVDVAPPHQKKSRLFLNPRDESQVHGLAY